PLRRVDDTPPPIDERTPVQGLPAATEAAAPPPPEPTKRLATPREPERTGRLAVPPSGSTGRPLAAAEPATAPRRTAAEPGRPRPEPERIKGPPFVLPGREPRAIERRSPVRPQQPRHIAGPALPTEELSEL